MKTKLKDKLNGEIEYLIADAYRQGRMRYAAERDKLKAINAELVESLKRMVARYTNLVHSGDAGCWDCEQEIDVIAAREIIAKATK